MGELLDDLRSDIEAPEADGPLGGGIVLSVTYGRQTVERIIAGLEAVTVERDAALTELDSLRGRCERQMEQLARAQRVEEAARPVAREKKRRGDQSAARHTTSAELPGAPRASQDGEGDHG